MKGGRRRIVEEAKGLQFSHSGRRGCAFCAPFDQQRSKSSTCNLSLTCEGSSTRGSSAVPRSWAPLLCVTLESTAASGNLEKVLNGLVQVEAVKLLSLITRHEGCSRAHLPTCHLSNADELLRDGGEVGLDDEESSASRRAKAALVLRMAACWYTRPLARAAEASNLREEHTRSLPSHLGELVRRAVCIRHHVWLLTSIPAISLVSMTQAASSAAVPTNCLKKTQLLTSNVCRVLLLLRICNRSGCF